MEHFCPKLPINFGEIQKAITQESAKVIDKAPKGVLISMLENICRRLKLEVQCKAVIDLAGTN
jgi:hypothetical protein